MTLSNALLLAQTESTCTLNGKAVSCDEVAEGAGKFLLGFGVFFILMIIFGLLATALTIWMIIDAAQRDFEDRALWIVLILFTGPVGAVAYYFAVKRKEDTAVNPQNTSSPTSHASQPAPQQPKTGDSSPSDVVQPEQSGDDSSKES